MSYCDLSDKCLLISKHMKKGCNVVSGLSVFFKAYKKLNESYTASMLKLLEPLMINVQDGSSTLEIAMDSLYSSIKLSLIKSQEFCKNMQLEIIEPLDVFFDHYTETITPFLATSDSTYKQLTKAKETMVKTRHKYYQSSAAAEKSSNTDEKNSKTQQSLRNQSQKSSEDYFKSIEQVNKLTEDYDTIVPDLMKNLQQNEESRIHFLRIIFEKFIKNLTKKDLVCCESFENVLGLLNNVNSEIDIKVFVDTHKGKYKGGVKEEFVSYQKWRDRRKELNEIEIREGSDNYEEDLDKAVNYVLGNDEDSDSSFSEIDCEEPDHGKISESFKFSNFRVYFLEILENKKHKSSLTLGRMQMLAAYFKSLLTSIVVDEDKDPYVFCKVLSLMHEFHTKQKKSEYLSQLLKSHSIWNDKLRWVEGIEYAISLKVAHDKESLKSFPNPSKKKGLFGALKKIANKFPGVFHKDSLGENEKTAAFIIMTQFSSYMTYLSLPLDVCNSILLMCSQRANLDKNRTCTLLAELEASQRSTLQLITPLEESLKARNKERKRFTDLIHVGLALDFLTPQNTVQLLFVNKQWRSKLMISVLRKCLLNWNLPICNQERLRKFTWTKLLNTHMREIDYNAFLNKVKTAAVPDIEEVIALDVARSYQNSQIVQGDALKNILNVYAFYNTGVGYCQGMNYIAGTIFYLFRNEETALKIMVALIEKYQMTELFENDLPKLKQFFYQLDRLISIQLPDLHDQFRELNVTSGHFCSSWFITLFASHLQNKPEILAQLWDLFLFDGWKTIFKAAIVILDKLNKQIPNAKFEDIMFALSSIQTISPIIDVFDSQFISDVEGLVISNTLLKELEAEYVHLKERAEKYTKSS